MAFDRCIVWAETIGKEGRLGPAVREDLGEDETNIVMFRHDQERVSFVCLANGDTAAAFVEGPVHLLKELGLTFESE